MTPSRGSRPSFDTPLSDTLQPFCQFVIKLCGQCNLSCASCRVFESPGIGWASKPRVISSEVLERIAARIAEHAVAHRVRVGVSLGGTAEAHYSRRAHSGGRGSRRITPELVLC